MAAFQKNMSEENKNIEEEQPAENIPEVLQSEIPSSGGEIITGPQTPSFAEATKDKKEEMEVHHSHTAHGKKNWKSYFREFLMLFLAVFCGFLAEYQLEHVIEHQREKTLMRSLIEDLKTDDNQLQTYIGWRTETNKDFDSLLLLLPKSGIGTNSYFIYRLANRSVLRFGLPDISERTILQLKNAGGLRLIRSIAVSEAINKHYMNVNRLKSNYETERFIRLRLTETRSDILDAGLSINANALPEEYRLITKEPAMINRFMNDILAAKQVNRSLINQLDSARVSSTRLKELIEKEYHFK